MSAGWLLGSGMEKLPEGIQESSNYRPGEPLRPWEDTRIAGADLALAIKGARAEGAVVRLINGEDLSQDEIIAFGRLNALCVLRWYEPLVNLLGPRSPELLPQHVDLVRKHTKLFRSRPDSGGSTSSSDEPVAFAAPLATQLHLFIDHHRGDLGLCLEGMSEEEARTPLVPSKTTLLGLVKHATFVEQVWFDEAITGRSRADIGCPAGPDESFDLLPEDTIDSVLSAYIRVCAASRKAAAGRDLDDIVYGNRRGPLPMRWIYLHVLRELAQHCGHADILREQIIAARATLSTSTPKTSRRQVGSI